MPGLTRTPVPGVDVVADAEKLPSDAASFDGGLCTQALQSGAG
jgi:hypothetical protein